MVLADILTITAKFEVFATIPAFRVQQKATLCMSKKNPLPDPQMPGVKLACQEIA